MRRPKRPATVAGDAAEAAASEAKKQTRAIREKMIDDAIDSLVKRNDSVRANIRDMARWFVVGLGSILTLAIGATSLSGFGSMEFDFRFALALVSLVAGVLLCVKPLFQAIDLMTMATNSREEVYTAPKFAAARALVTRAYLSENSREGNRTFEGLARQLEEAKQNPPPANEEAGLNWTLVYKNIAFKVREALELAVTTELRQRLDVMLNTLRRVVPWVVFAMAVFVWAANPPKDATEHKVVPYEQKIAWSAADEAALKDVGVSVRCLAAGHPRLLVISERANQRSDVIAVFSTTDCPAARLILTNENHLSSK